MSALVLCPLVAVCADMPCVDWMADVVFWRLTHRAGDVIQVSVGVGGGVMQAGLCACCVGLRSMPAWLTLTSACIRYMHASGTCMQALLVIMGQQQMAASAGLEAQAHLHWPPRGVSGPPLPPPRCCR